MVSDAAATTGQVSTEDPIGGVQGAPPHSRAAALLDRVASGAGAGTVQISAPFTGGSLSTLPQAADADVRDVYARARVTQKEWVKTPVAERQRILLKLHKLILDRQSEGLDLVQVETGKSRLDAFDEISAAALAATYYGKHSAKILRKKHRAGVLPVLTKADELRHPKGVVGIISPWNYPLALTALDVLPALVAGNAVVQKPDNQTALTALWLHELAEEAGLPAGMWQIVLGRGSVIGDAIIEESNYVGFTGSTPSGKNLAGKIAERLTSYSLELGGKNPMIVLPDAKVPTVAEGATAACFSSAGQLCVSVERIYVHESIRENFAKAFADKAKAVKLGASLDFSAGMGSLTSDDQLKTISSHVDDATSKGATVLAGGKHRPDIGPLFYEPTVLTDVTPDMTLFAEETFGPVVSIYSYTDIEDAIQLANDTPYGLNASVWTGNGKLGREVAARIKSGTVNVNDGFAASFGSIDAPMGGVGDSGVGRRNGSEGILRYTESQTIATQRLLRLRPIMGIPARAWARIMTVGMRALRRLPR